MARRVWLLLGKVLCADDDRVVVAKASFGIWPVSVMFWGLGNREGGIHLQVAGAPR